MHLAQAVLDTNYKSSLPGTLQIEAILEALRIVTEH